MQQGQPNAGRILNQWGGKLALFFSYTHFSHDLPTGLLAALLPFIRLDMELNYLQSGLLVSVYALTAGFSQVLMGWLADRIGRQKTMAIGLGGIGICSVAIGLSSSYIALLSILITMGVLAGAYHPSAVPTLSRHFERARRGKAIALHVVGGSIGFGVAPILASVIASSLNWHFAYLILSLPAIAGALLVLFRLKLPAQSAEMSEAGKIALETKLSVSSVVQVFRSLALVLFLAVGVHLITNPAMAFIPLYLVDKHHLSPALAASLLSIVRVGGLAGGLFGGWLADKWGRERSIFLTLVATGPVLYLLATMPFNAVLIAVFVVFGFLGSMREATAQTYLMENSPPRLQATVFGIYFGLGMEGNSLIQPVAGRFMDIIGIAQVFNAIAWISIAFSALSAALGKKYFSRPAGFPSGQKDQPR